MHLQDKEEKPFSAIQIQAQEQQQQQKVQIIQKEVQACMEQVPEMFHLWTKGSLCKEMPQQKGKVSKISSSD